VNLGAFVAARKATAEIKRALIPVAAVLKPL
jgi:hypothetical protein